MSTRNLALILGIVFIAAGVAGFVPALVHAPPGGDLGMPGHGELLGLFPVNTLHNIVHLLFGLWGLAASRSTSGAVMYGRGVAIIYALLAIMGLIPATQDGFGLVPLWGKDVWLHVGLGLVGAYIGWVNHPPPA